MRNDKHKRRKRKLKKKVLISTAVLLAAAGASVLLNKQEIAITVNGQNPLHVEAGTVFRDPGATARRRGSIYRMFGYDLDVAATGNVDTSRPGEYQVEYSADDEHETKMIIRKVIVEDTTPPEIILTEDPDAYTLYDHPFEEIGFVASDICDGNLTDKVVSEEKDGVVYYTVTDAAGNIGKAERKIVYDDRKGPVIDLITGNEIVWYAADGDYKDQFTAIDDLDGDISDQVKVIGTIKSEPGDYTLTYTVKDAHGNESKAERLVHVQLMQVNSGPVAEDGKTIYLTFDDGPGPYTNQLLDILAKYKVRATFFTTSAYGYADCMTRAANEGHTVAVHTSYHRYEDIYSSTDAYWNDFNNQNNVIKQQTGSYSTLFRFPGGSSNTISANYSQGIVSKLAEQAAAKGYEYFDWNVSSGDAGGTESTDQVYENVINGVQKNSAADIPSVVLQHDVKDFSVNAVERIIKWGLKNGYNFQALQPGSFHAKHGIYN